MNARKTAGSDLALGAGSVGSRPWLLRMHSFGARFRVGVVALSRCGVRLQREKIIRWKPGFWRRHGLTSHDTILRTLPLRHAGNLPRQLSNQLPEHSFVDHS